MSSRIIVGEALARLAELPDESVHCVVTSPPYWGLRDYGTAAWDGGDEGCDHVASEIRTGLGLAAWSAEHARGGGHKAGEVDKILFRDVCGKCGARRTDEQLGLERTPQEFIARLVVIMREVRRVLRRDGVCWLNIGDCYATGAGAVGEAPGGGAQGERWKQYGPAGHRGSRPPSGKHAANVSIPMTQPNRMPIAGLKPKDLVMVPARLGIALQDDGWWVRSDVIWSKPNPMPESIEDRPTQSHEHVFMLTRSRRYFYDHVAVREGSPEGERRRQDVRQPSSRDLEKLGNGHNGHGYAGNRGEQERGGGRNRRNVWEIATQPYPEAHFATFPTKLVEPCVLAGSSPRVCGVCAAPWRRVTERVASGWDGSVYGERAVQASGGALSGGTEQSTLGSSNGSLTAEHRTVGWEPSCGHRDDSGRAVVLDPFAGSGTVGVVCEWLGRDFVGVELNPEYAAMAEARIAAEGPLGRRARRAREVAAEQLGLGF